METKSAREAHSQEHWAMSDASTIEDREAEDDREDVCEDEGGDIQDQPHDAGYDEPLLGWRAMFDGGGSIAARAVLRNLRSRRPDVRQNHVGGWSVGAHAPLRVDGFRIGGYRETATRLPDATVMRTIEPRDNGLIPEIDHMVHYRPAHGHRS